ncbi:patatin-like phospholipase family protein [Natrinema hispanicum]|uniref:NTE family protein n=1 Tax=Natrinema hispanicum TaxID=392421 RepID=A0A1I0IQ85_9EURY|nr:patatin-like phospholipase family protein [Natrinema hispanicum]SDD24854.1 NTE family protein [Natrinema hispanicum]SET99359.1 NTE family protein [Natrinema hispanicum]
MSEGDPTRVAIACQGGGSHTAFTAGVLRTLLAEWDDAYELVGISGTSGGAFNALGMWYGLVTGDADRARATLDGLWTDLAADGGQDRWLNSLVTTISRLESAGFPLPSISPYQVLGPEVGKQRIKTVLERHIDFDAIPDLCQKQVPELVIGTVDINAGVFETFVNEAVTVDAVLASAAVPNLFEAVEIHGHLHWDGLFSQNPPVNDLMGLPPERKPEELWIIQINPQEFEGEPGTLDVIADRRNELSGNISLNQELGFIERVNEWIADGKLPADEFQQTTIRRIHMGTRFHCSTKVDRDPAFLNELRSLGNQRAREFLDSRPGS